MTKDKEAEKFVKDLKEAGEKSGHWDVLTGQEAWDFINKEMNKPEHVKARAENERKQKSRLDKFFEKKHKYNWTKGMGEISGFGGSYEQGCRAMVIAGLEYWDKYPSLDPKFKGFKEVYGIMQDDNEDARKLDYAVLDVVDRDCTGAMHQAAISAIFYVHKHGWEKYVQEMSKPEKK